VPDAKGDSFSTSSDCESTGVPQAADEPTGSVFVIDPADVPALNSPEPVTKVANEPESVTFLHRKVNATFGGVCAESRNQVETIICVVLA
jgi:hypothetical protein